LGHGGRKGCIPKRFVLQQRTQTTDERRPLPSPAEQSRAAPSAIPAGIDRFPAGRRSLAAGHDHLAVDPLLPAFVRPIRALGELRRILLFLTGPLPISSRRRHRRNTAAAAAP